jgi:hypothetical protein
MITGPGAVGAELLGKVEFEPRGIAHEGTDPALQGRMLAGGEEAAGEDAGSSVGCLRSWYDRDQRILATHGQNRRAQADSDRLGLG